MNWFAENMAEALVAVGLALLIIEILILGFATLFLLFVGIAAIVTGALMYMAVIPDTLFSALLSMAICTALAAALLWKPMKTMQKDVDTKKTTNDLVGHRFTLTDAVSEDGNPEYKFSGIKWRLKSDAPLKAGQHVEVVHTDVGVLKIRAVS